MYDTTWYSSYLAEPKVVRYGTKPLPVEETTTTPPPEDTTTAGTTTGTTTKKG
jgi:hypothetical protein